MATYTPYKVDHVRRVVVPGTYSFVFGREIAGKAGVEAHVAFDNGSALVYSRLDGTTTWKLDARFNRHGFPEFVNGFASALSHPLDSNTEIIAALNAAAEGV